MALPRTGRLLFLLALVVVGLGTSTYLPLPSPVITFRLPGTPAIVGLTLTPTRQVGLVLAWLACALVDNIMRGDRRLAGAGLARTFPYWVLPALLILGAFGLGLYENLVGLRQQVLGLAVAALALGLVIVAQLCSLDSADRWFWPARLGLNAVASGLAFGLYFYVQRLPWRSLVAIPFVALVSALLALQLVAGVRSSTARTWGTAALVGLMMGELAWALSPGVLPPLAAALLLLLAFYVLTGLLQQHLWGRLNRQVVGEFLAVGALGFILILRLLA